MKTTRQKRPDRVICKWKDYRVVMVDGSVYIDDEGDYVLEFPQSEIPNLIKALEEIQK